MIQFVFDEKAEVIRITYTGEINIEDYSHLFKTLVEVNSTKPFPKNLLVLSDYRKAHASFVPKDMGELWSLMEQHFVLIESIKEAMLHSSPYETALSEIAAKNIPDNRYEMKIFSYETNAIKWLIS